MQIYFLSEFPVKITQQDSRWLYFMIEKHTEISLLIFRNNNLYGDQCQWKMKNFQCWGADSWCSHFSENLHVKMKVGRPQDPPVAIVIEDSFKLSFNWFWWWKMYIFSTIDKFTFCKARDLTYSNRGFTYPSWSKL